MTNHNNRHYNGIVAEYTGIKPARYIAISETAAFDIEGDLVEEAQICISVNGNEWATFMASPQNLEAMALGFLANENIITSLADVRDIHISRQKTCVDVWLHDLAKERPRKFIITAGCGGGITFDDLSARHEPLQSNLTASPKTLAKLMRDVHLGANMYRRARGIHTAALANANGLLLQVEDIGRHNCMDKLRGLALMENIETEGHILLTSGRISSEMINKARRMGTPIVCSRTSPTTMSVALAEAWNMTIVAYLRQDRMRVYTHPERIVTV
jgi:FdhD protein